MWSISLEDSTSTLSHVHLSFIMYNHHKYVECPFCEVDMYKIMLYAKSLYEGFEDLLGNCNFDLLIFLWIHYYGQIKKFSFLSDFLYTSACRYLWWKFEALNLGIWVEDMEIPFILLEKVVKKFLIGYTQILHYLED